jgi:hypothetical protein
MSVLVEATTITMSICSVNIRTSSQEGRQRMHLSMRFGGPEKGRIIAIHWLSGD